MGQKAAIAAADLLIVYTVMMIVPSSYLDGGLKGLTDGLTCSLHE
jgi:hypothetical protein